MKNKYIKLAAITIMIFSLTGCATVLKDEDGDTVKNPVTGQNIIENIVCRPTDSVTINTYEENGVNIESLPECSKFSLSDTNYEGIWVTIFIKPLSLLLIKLGELLSSYGFAIISVTLLLRLIAYPLTKKTAEQSENMQKAKPKLEKLEAKYKDKTDQESMMAKSQEMMLIYKDNNINPMSSIGFAVIQMFLFFAFYESINRVPVLFEENFLGIFQLGTTPLVAIENGDYHYIIFTILIVIATYFSFKLNSQASTSKEAAAQMKLMSRIMIVFISIVSFNMPVGIGLYWVFNSTFTIIQNLIVKRVKKND